DGSASPAWMPIPSASNSRQSSRLPGSWMLTETKSGYSAPVAPAKRSSAGEAQQVGHGECASLCAGQGRLPSGLHAAVRAAVGVDQADEHLGHDAAAGVA